MTLRMNASTNVSAPVMKSPKNGIAWIPSRIHCQISSSVSGMESQGIQGNKPFSRSTIMSNVMPNGLTISASMIAPTAPPTLLNTSSARPKIGWKTFKASSGSLSKASRRIVIMFSGARSGSMNMDLPKSSLIVCP